MTQTIEHRGYRYRRTAIDDFTGRFEHAFAVEWEKENNKPFGCTPILATLLSHEKDEHRDPFGYAMMDREWTDGPMTQRDARVAATVIQWLGTAVGRSFLETALKRAGFRLMRIEEQAR